MSLFKNQLCVGCGLCESVTNGKVKMTLDPDGFLRPKKTQKVPADEYKSIKQCCPATIIHKDKSLRTPHTDSFWGDYFQCYIGSSSSDAIEKEASSGGIISTILIFLLKNKIIDYVIHIGPDPENPLLNIVKLSSNSKEVLENADSRYAPSAALANILQIIENGKYYAFVGKPCDVSALRSYSKFNQTVANQIKYYFSFFCFGVPSLNQTKKLTAQLGIQEEQVQSIVYRKNGWPGSFNVIAKDGTCKSILYKDYMHFLFSDIHIRCKICPEGLGESADISSGDGWSEFDEKGYPSFKNARGRSIIFSKTHVGDKLLSKIINAGHISIEEQVEDLRSLDKIQPGQFGKKKYHKYRILAFKISGKKTPKIDSYIYKNIHVLEKVNLRTKLSQLIGTWKRINLK